MTHKHSATPAQAPAPDRRPARDDSPVRVESPDAPSTQGSAASCDPGLRHRLISEAAYALYVARGYQDGHATEDWLVAEDRVDRELRSDVAPA